MKGRYSLMFLLSDNLKGVTVVMAGTVDEIAVENAREYATKKYQEAMDERPRFVEFLRPEVKSKGAMIQL